ncbi:MAG: hypothetical protein WDW36_005938 [Sanguina aurantia]
MVGRRAPARTCPSDGSFLAGLVTAAGQAGGIVDTEWGARGGPLGMAVSVFMFSLLGGGVWLYVHGVDAGLPRYISVRAHAFLMQDNRFILAPADVSISKVIAYKVDQWFSTSPSSKVLALAAATVSLILSSWFALFFVGTASLYDTFWTAVAGAGLDWTFSDTAVKDDASAFSAFMVRLVALLVSVGGMLITALLLGIVSDAISSKMDELKRGKSLVLEVGHCLIIGWSEKVYCLVEQIAMGSEHAGGRAIVIMSEREKSRMEDEIANHNINIRNSYIICRQGDALMTSELEKVSAAHASSIVLLADSYAPQESDARMLRTLLCLMQLDKSQQLAGRNGLMGNIVAEVCDRDHEALMHTLSGGPRLRTIVSRDMVGRMMVQCARYPQLAHVIEELIGYTGNEFYFDDTYSHLLVGRTFFSLQELFPDAVPMGIKGSDGKVVLNPNRDYKLLPDALL